MEVRIREYRPGDSEELLEVFHLSNDSLRVSRGGNHPDERIDKLQSYPKKHTLRHLTHNAVVLVAEAEGEIAGFGGFSNGLLEKILKSTYGKSLYVRPEYQRGKKGVSIGSLLYSARRKEAARRGFRKLYSYSVPEAVAFQKKQGATFHPFHDTYSLNPEVKTSYFELELRKSFLNNVRVEPYIFELRVLISRLFRFLEGER